jgi:hypothetical protein
MLGIQLILGVLAIGIVLGGLTWLTDALSNTNTQESEGN